MPRDPERFRARKEERLSELTEAGEVSEEDAERIRELVDAFDEDKLSVPRPEWSDAPDHIRGYKADTTLGRWIGNLTRYARRIDGGLADADADDINHFAEDLLSGDAPDVKPEGLSSGSIRNYQTSCRMFYRYHDDLDVSWSDITTPSRTNGNGGGNSSFDPDDILTREEIDEIRSVINDYRDSAVFHILLFTGMRNRALRTLRIRDVNPAEGFYRFNPEEGTKDIHEPRARRPLLGAQGPVADWVEHHPAPDDPDAYLITSNSKFTTPDPSEPVSDRTIQRIMDRLKEEAGIDKPLHPHMLRHNYVYICKIGYEMPDDTIRHNLGHAPGSTIMEETYSHLSAEDHFERARIAAGEIDPDADDVGFELETCPTCNANLAEDANLCHRCGTPITPEGEQLRDDVRDDAVDTVEEAASAGDDDVAEVAKQIVDMADDPDALRQLADQLESE